ncbi:hypothetical protein BS78_01G286500 [Paspalum vaginatum]|nr:hypothetical protein BS78_01G286500 [Paspalum vaginatum]
MLHQPQLTFHESSWTAHLSTHRKVHEMQHWPFLDAMIPASRISFSVVLQPVKCISIYILFLGLHMSSGPLSNEGIHTTRQIQSENNFPLSHQRVLLPPESKFVDAQFLDSVLHGYRRCTVSLMMSLALQSCFQFRCRQLIFLSELLNHKAATVSFSMNMSNLLVYCALIKHLPEGSVLPYALCSNHFVMCQLSLSQSAGVQLITTSGGLAATTKWFSACRFHGNNRQFHLALDVDTLHISSCGGIFKCIKESQLAWDPGHNNVFILAVVLPCAREIELLGQIYERDLHIFACPGAVTQQCFYSHMLNYYSIFLFTPPLNQGQGAGNAWCSYDMSQAFEVLPTAAACGLQIIESLLYFIECLSQFPWDPGGFKFFIGLGASRCLRRGECQDMAWGYLGRPVCALKDKAQSRLSGAIQVAAGKTRRGWNIQK